MRFLPRVHRRVLGTWLCLFFLLSVVFPETGDASPTTGIIPFLSAIPLLISYGATVSLVPDLILSSSTPPPAPRRHPTPIAASHDFNPRQGRWIVSDHTTFDDETLYNIAIRRPLNRTAKFVTGKHVSWIGPDEFVGASATGENDAALESPTYNTPMPLGLIGFPGLELGTNAEELHPLGTHSDNGHGTSTSFTDFNHEESCFSELLIHRARTGIAFHPDSNLIGSLFTPALLAIIRPFTKSLQLAVQPSRPETSIKTWKQAFERYGFVGILTLAVLIFLAADRIEPMIVKAVDKDHGAVLKTRLRVSEFRKGLCRRIAGLTTWCLTATGFSAGSSRPSSLAPDPSSSAPKRSETGLPIEEIIKALNERLERRDKKPAGPPFLSPAWAKLHRPGKVHTLTKSSSSSLRKIELPPPEPRHISSPLSKEKEKHQLWNGDGSINPLWIPVPPATDMEWDFLEGNTLTVTEEDQAEQGVALEVQAVPLNVSTNAAPNHPVVPPPLHPLASSPTILETTPEVAGNHDSVPIDEKTEKEDSPTLNPSAPNSSGIVPSAQVSGPMPEGGSLGALKLDSSSSVPLATIERLRAILWEDTSSSSSSSPGKAYDSGAALSAQVSGSAPQTGFLGKRLEVEAAGPSAKHSRIIVQENIERIENANRRGKSSVRKTGAIVARLDSIAEDVSDSTVSSDAPTIVVVSSSSTPPLVTTDAAIQPPADADEPSNSGADSSAQVSGTVPKTGFLGKLGSRRLEVEAAVASTRQSRMVIQANIDRIEKGNERKRSSGRRKRATLARREASCLDSIAEDLEDSPVPSNTAPIVTSFSPPTPATTNTAVEPPNNAYDQDAISHPLSQAFATEDTVEKKPKKVVTFSNHVRVQYLPKSRWDCEARKKFHSEAKGREIEDQYRVWAKGKQPAEGYRHLTTPAMKSVGGGPRSFFFDDDDEDGVDEEGFSKSEQKKAKVESKRSGESVFYGATTSQDGGRSLSEDEWNRLEKYQAVRLNPAAKEVIRP